MLQSTDCGAALAEVGLKLRYRRCFVGRFINLLVDTIGCGFCFALDGSLCDLAGDEYFEFRGRLVIVGDNTFGKPVGQIGLTFCEKILRPTAFQTVNSAGFGDYFNGLPVDCAAADDLDVAVGDPTDPNMVSALGYLATGACPVISLPGGQFKPGVDDSVPELDRRGPPWREFANAF